MIKLCECGCRQPTKIIKVTRRKQGLIKGEYRKFIKGHHRRKESFENFKQRIGNRFCECGCGQKIIPILRHKYEGMPRFIHGHNKRKLLKLCKTEGCNEKHYCKGFCIKCYYIVYNKEREKRRKQYRQDNKERFAEYRKYYSQTPNGKAIIKAKNQNRRTLESDLTKETIKRVYEDNIKKYGVLTCYLCGEPIIFGDERLRDSLEHSTPVTRKGSNDYENLGVAHLNCNLRKGTKTLKEWFNNNNKKET